MHIDVYRDLIYIVDNHFICSCILTICTGYLHYLRIAAFWTLSSVVNVPVEEEGK